MLYLFHLRIGCISTRPCGHLFISPIFPHKNIYFQKTPGPLSIIMVTPYASISVAVKSYIMAVTFSENAPESAHHGTSF